MPSDDAAYGLYLLDVKRTHYRLLRDYDAGIQPWMFASDKLRDLYEHLMRKYRLNVCRPVVRGVTRRVSIDAMDGDERGTEWHRAQLLRH